MFLRPPALTADEVFLQLQASHPDAQVARAVTAVGVDIVGVCVPRDRVRRVWETWRCRHGETGWWPYVTSSSPEGEAGHHDGRGHDAAEWERSVEELVRQDHDARAASLVISSFRWSVQGLVHGDEEFEEWRDDYDHARLAPLLGPAVARPLPGVSRWATESGALFGRGMRWINFVAARGGYEVPVLLPHLYGTGNWFGYGCLTPLDDAAVLRRWQEKWGAQLFFAAGPYLELVVDRPPLDPHGAAQAATELHAYCSDTVQDLTKTGDGMARSSMWSLWWD
ncbi:DUF4253 domain-containing protein [Streptomyces tritici]|uniref:DUF4253 domain-containing protein n=1 Tax=Streptomyces tritici TaxID=2054410 RepID=UPI003AF0B19C